LKKKEACFLSSWNDGVPTLLLVLPLLKINMIQNRGSDELKGGEIRAAKKRKIGSYFYIRAILPIILIT
jgi:hypothetical protein